MYFFRKNGNKVYIVYNKDGKLKTVPRADIRHLDTLPDDQVQLAVDRLKAIYKIREIKPDTTPCPDQLKERIEQFLSYLKTKNRDQQTINQYRTYLLKAGSFLGWPLTAWPDKSRGFGEWSKDMSPWVAHRVRMYIIAFWNWSLALGYANGALYILPIHLPANDTPLKHVFTPADIFAMRFESPDLELIILLGYFFSLRPQEIMALTKSDFSAGTPATKLECCKVMAQIELYSKLAVRVERQRKAASMVKGEEKKVTKAPKKHSFGWIACFDEGAAKRIVTLIKERSDRLFHHGVDWYSAQLRRSGFQFTLKDLRRASLYWLGHHTEINPIQLKNHARHKKLETTMLYCRRPDSDVERGLDLDA